MSPLFAFALTGIALATLLGGLLNRRGQWRRILVGIAAAFLFEAIGLCLVNAVSKSPGLAPLIYLNVVLTSGFAVYFLNRRSRGRRAGADAAPAHTA